MLKFDQFGIEKIDSRNFGVFTISDKLDVNGNPIKKNIYYYSTLEKALNKVRNLYANSKYSNRVQSVDSAITKIKEADNEFITFLSKLNVKTLQKAFPEKEIISKDVA
jgi:hypothetical protein